MQQTTEGVKLSDLDPLPNGPQPNDLIETSTRRVTDPDRYESRHSPAASVMTPPATTEVIGSMLLAVVAEAGGEASNIVVTSEGLAQVIIDVLKYAIEGTSGVTCSYDNGTGILTISKVGGDLILHIGDSGTGEFGSNIAITSGAWTGLFGSTTPSTLPSGTLGEFELTALATASGGTVFYVVIKGAQTRDFFTEITVQGLIDTPADSATCDAYFIQESGGAYYTFWRFAGYGLGDFEDLGDRNVVFNYNPDYQTDATTETFLFSPGSLYAWFSWPDPDTGDGDSYQGRVAQGGKMDVYAGFANPLYPSSGSFGDPAIFGKHNGVAIGTVEGSTDQWVLLFLQNSDGTENYELSGPCFATPLYTTSAVYHTVDNDVSWGTKAYGWNVSVLGWGGVGFDEFTLTNLD